MTNCEFGVWHLFHQFYVPDPELPQFAFPGTWIARF